MFKVYKPLIYLFIAIAILASTGCIWENYRMKKSYTCNPFLAHMEIHADRPIEEIAREIVRENESKDDRIQREAQEKSQENEWEAMS